MYESIEDVNKKDGNKERIKEREKCKEYNNGLRTLKNTPGIYVRKQQIHKTRN